MVQSAVVRYAKESTVTVIINMLELKIGDVYNTVIIMNNYNNYYSYR